MVRKALKCNACFVVLDELLPALRMERAKKRRHLSPDEFIPRPSGRAGRRARSTGCRCATTQSRRCIRRARAVSRAEGSWISNYIATTCGQIISDYDAVLKEAAFGKVSWNDLRAAVCQRGKTVNGTRGGTTTTTTTRTDWACAPRTWTGGESTPTTAGAHGETVKDEDVERPGPGAVRASESCC